MGGSNMLGTLSWALQTGHVGKEAANALTVSEM